MVRPEEVSRARQRPNERCGGATFADLGAGNGSRIGHQYCSVGFWHDAKYAGIRQQHEQQQQKQAISVPLMPQPASGGGDVPEMAVGHGGGRSDAVVQSLARQLDLQRLTDGGRGGGDAPALPGGGWISGAEVSQRCACRRGAIELINHSRELYTTRNPFIHIHASSSPRSSVHALRLSCIRACSLMCCDTPSAFIRWHARACHPRCEFVTWHR
jgi:hypothetical protein